MLSIFEKKHQLNQLNLESPLKTVAAWRVRGFSGLISSCSNDRSPRDGKSISKSSAILKLHLFVTDRLPLSVIYIGGEPILLDEVVLLSDQKDGLPFRNDEWLFGYCMDFGETSEEYLLDLSGANSTVHKVAVPKKSLQKNAFAFREDGFSSSINPVLFLPQKRRLDGYLIAAGSEGRFQQFMCASIQDKNLGVKK